MDIVALNEAANIFAKNLNLSGFLGKDPIKAIAEALAPVLAEAYDEGRQDEHIYRTGGRNFDNPYKEK